MPQSSVRPPAPPSPLHLVCLGGLSAAVLAFEVLLLRLFEFSHWHHFAGLAIALALLGLGTAGTVLTLLGDRAVRAGDTLLVAGLLATAAGLLLVVALHARIALRPAFATWDAGELLQLLAVDFAAFLPFLGAGLVIGQAFARWPRHTRSVYAANLLGSGLGSVGASLLLVMMQVESAIVLVAASLPALGATFGLLRRSVPVTLSCAAALAAASLFVMFPPAPAVSDFKALSLLRELPDAAVLEERPGLPGRLTLIRSASIREAPGLSLAWTEPVPPMDAVVVGSDRVVPLLRDYRRMPDYGQASLAGLAPRLRPDGNVLVLGSSAWNTPANAGNSPVWWVDPDVRLLGLAQARGMDHRRLVHDNPYRHLSVTDRRHGAIAFDVAYGGADAATEDYLLTTQGLTLAFGRLRSDGLLAIPLELHYPPRHFPRVLATLTAALVRHGVETPGAHVAVLRGLQSLLILASPQTLADDDVSRIRDFARRWSFDLAWLPGLDASEANRHHRLDAPVFYLTTRAVLTTQPLPDIATWFVTGEASAERPYIWRSLEWGRARALVATQGRRGLSYLDWSLILSAVATVAVILLAFALILAPLGRLPDMGPPLRRPGVAAYFCALGLGYLLVELAMFQRTILFLGEPVLTASVVFAVFLLGSGLGSAMAPQKRGRRQVNAIYLPIAGGLALATAGLWLLGDSVLAFGIALRAGIIAALLLPLAWALGRAFPWGLRQLADRPRWVPWAWGINGFASVAAASMATLISVHHGQPATILAGVACYVVAFGVARHWTVDTRAGTAANGDG